MNPSSEVVTALAAARRGVQLYPPAHPAYGEALQALVTAVGDATREGSLVLNWFQGRLYHDSVVFPDDVHGAASIAESFESRGIESLTFAPGFTEHDALGLIEVLSLKPSSDFDFTGELAARSVTGVTASALEDEEDPEREEADRQRQADRALHQRMAGALRRLQDQFSAGASGDLTETGALVGNVMERLMADPSAVMGLATIQSSSDRDLFHSLNVMIYALLLGHRLGLPEEGMASLGMSALLHDVGKAAFVADDPAQAEPMRVMHPTVGAEILQRVALEDPSPMLVAYEHHLRPDGSGWPESSSDYVSHPYSRMVEVANRYDNLLNPTADAVRYTPDRAVVQLLQEAGTWHDPFFARLFASALGVFPVGCLVRLSDNSVGVVARIGDDPLAPTIRLAYDERGTELEEPDEIDLAQSDKRIVEVISPDALNVNVSDKL